MASSREQMIKQAIQDYEHRLIGYTLSILKDAERSQDVVQEAFMKLCKQDVEKLEKNIKSWLFTVCRNRALDVLRKEQRVSVVDESHFRTISDETRTPDRQIDHNERLAQVTQAVNHLNKNQQEIIRLKFEQGMSYQEISDITGLSVTNVGFILHTSLKKLRAILPNDLTENH